MSPGTLATSQIHLVEGPVGAGKSTYAGRLALEIGAAHMDLDDWMVRLFRPDRPEVNFIQWYQERKERCLEQIWAVSLDLIEKNQSVVLELGLVQRVDREAFYARVDGADIDMAVYLLDAPEDVRWERVERRNREQGATFKMEVSPEIFQVANGAWQPPDEAEIQDRDIVEVS